MILDHIGIVVRNLENGINEWESFFGYEQFTMPVINSRQKVRVVFLRKHDSPEVKLIEPSEKSSPIFAFAKRGGGLHHLCFRCKNLNEDLMDLKRKGARILHMPEPGEAFAGNDIAFVYAAGLNVELIQTEARAEMMDSERDSKCLD